MFGFPADGISAIAAVDQVMDMARTTVVSFYLKTSEPYRKLSCRCDYSEMGRCLSAD